MQKRIYTIPGIIFLLLGIFFFSISKANITGAVIGVDIKPQTTFILGLIFIAISAVLLVAGRKRKLERAAEEEYTLLHPREYATEILSVEKDPKKRAIIIDSSAVLPFSPTGVGEILSRYDKAFVPEEVIDEVEHKEKVWARKGYQKGTPRTDLLERYIEADKIEIIKEKNIERYRGISKKWLGKTDKAKFYEKITHILDEKDPKKREEMMEELPRSLRMKYRNMAKKIISYLKEEGKPITEENFRKEIEAHYKVSKADIDVLATALYQARRGKTAIVQEKDKDFEQAVDLIRKRAKKPGTRNIGKKIKPVSPYL